MRASTKGLLVSAFVLSLSGAAYAQGAAGPGVALVLAAPAVPREATALDKAERGWGRRMKAAPPAQRPARPVRARWEQRQAARRSK
jgi:hypothetical protein